MNGIKHLTKLQLEQLNLCNSSATGDFLKELKDLPSLKRLSLRATQITDNGLDPFHDSQLSLIDNTPLSSFFGWFQAIAKSTPKLRDHLGFQESLTSIRPLVSTVLTELVAWNGGKGTSSQLQIAILNR